MVDMEKGTCKGFRFSGIAAGIKKKGGKDLGLIISEAPASVAGVFTRNRIQAAPVLLDRRRVRSGPLPGRHCQQRECQLLYG